MKKKIMLMLTAFAATFSLTAFAGTPIKQSEHIPRNPGKPLFPLGYFCIQIPPTPAPVDFFRKFFLHLSPRTW